MAPRHALDRIGRGAGPSCRGEGRGGGRPLPRGRDGYGESVERGWGVGVTERLERRLQSLPSPHSPLPTPHCFGADPLCGAVRTRGANAFLTPRPAAQSQRGFALHPRNVPTKRTPRAHARGVRRYGAALNLAGYCAPLRKIITGSVFAMMRMSSTTDRRSMYARSNATLRRTSSIDVS